MAHQPGNVHPPTPLTLDQALQNILAVILHMPKESQLSFSAMVFGTPSILPSHEAPAVPTVPLRLPLTPDVLRGVVQAKTYVCCLSTLPSV